MSRQLDFLCTTLCVCGLGERRFSLTQDRKLITAFDEILASGQKWKRQKLLCLNSLMIMMRMTITKKYVESVDKTLILLEARSQRSEDKLDCVVWLCFLSMQQLAAQQQAFQAQQQMQEQAVAAAQVC